MPRVILKAVWKKPPKVEFFPEDNRFVLEDRLPEAFRNSKPDFEMLEKHHNIINTADRLPWREVLLCLTDIKLSKDLLTLRGRRMASTSVINMRKNLPLAKYGVETAINAITLSKDEKELIIGIRGGDLMTGTHSVVPAGGVSYSENPLVDAVIEEAKEELGLEPSDIIKSSLIGYISQTDETNAPNDLFVYKNVISKELEELILIHKEAYQLYQSIAGEKESRQALTDNGYPIDAWEHTELYTLKNDPDTLIKFLIEKTEKDKLTQSLYGVCLFIYFQNLAGKLLRNVSSTKEQTEAN